MRTRSQKQAKLIGRIITYTILIAAAIVCLFPFIWMISTSFKETSDIYKMPPSLLPANPTLENFIEGWKGADFGMFFQNSAVVTFLATIGTVFSSSVVAYGFARFKSRLSPVLFMILLGTMMLPSQVTLIPQYLLYYKMGMVDTYWPLIIPSLFGGGAYNIFLYRQFFLSLPKELNEAATIDGASSFQTFIYIMMPAVKPVSMCVGVMSLVFNWNDFYQPLIYLNSTKKFTVAIGLQFLNSSMGTTKIGQMMAVAVVMTLPVLLIFFVCQKYFVQGIKMQGIKG